MCVDNKDNPMNLILYETVNSVAVITLNRPARHNAQNKQFLEELDEAWLRADSDSEVKVIVLRANGKHFSAGHDMASSVEEREQWQKDVKDIGFEGLYNFERVHYLGYARKWRDIPKPSIAAVQGACIAAGLMLCWPCDLIIAAEDAFFSDPVVMMGIGGVEYHGHTWELGARKAKELLFTGNSITADQAEKLGMVNRVVPLNKLEETTMDLANQIASKPSFALKMAKQAVNKTLDIMGQYAAQQAVFDTHWLGHGNAIAQSGWPALADLDQMQKSNKDGS